MTSALDLQRKMSWKKSRSPITHKIKGSFQTTQLLLSWSAFLATLFVLVLPYSIIILNSGFFLHEDDGGLSKRTSLCREMRQIKTYWKLEVTRYFHTLPKRSETVNINTYSWEKSMTYTVTMTKACQWEDERRWQRSTQGLIFRVVHCSVVLSPVRWMTLREVIRETVTRVRMGPLLCMRYSRTDIAGEWLVLALPRNASCLLLGVYIYKGVFEKEQKRESKWI